MDELTALENWAAPLLARLQPGERRTLARKIGT
ncbi:phage virion morphogenesis protein, partial [Xanthomonas vasicola pv. vasculorum]